MDKAQRDQIGEQFKATRESLGWSLRRLADEANVSVNTVRSLEHGDPVQPGSLGKIREALGIEPISEIVARAEEPADVHWTLDIVRMWLLGMDASERPAAAGDLVRFIVERGQNETGR